MFRLNSFVKNSFYKIGVDIRKVSTVYNPDFRRTKWLEHIGVNVVLDIGANTGQFGKSLRRHGYHEKIISFEPLSNAYELLKKCESKNWTTLNYALGERDEQLEIHVSENVASSSLLTMTARHEDVAPESKVIGTEVIKVHKLDTIVDSLNIKLNRTFVKIDTQGFEYSVLRGGEEALRKINFIQLEIALQELYKGEKLFSEMIDYLANLGYVLVSIDGGLTDKISGEMLQVDVCFQRKVGV